MPFTEKCIRCKREAPPAIAGPGGQVAEGWITYTGTPELTIDLPPEGALTPDVIEAISEADGIVTFECDPSVARPTIRERSEPYVGVVCPTCQDETGWDADDWGRFAIGL